MSKTVVILIGFVALVGAGCSSSASTTGGNTGSGCVVVYPDAGTAAGVVCDIGWSCNSDTQHFELSCTTSGSNYDCTCYSDGTAQLSFPVNAFTCDGAGAQPAATGGCGWIIQ